MRKRYRKAQCDNCGTEIRLESNYCPLCGQENHNPNQPIKNLFLELLESLFHFDTKLFSTLKNLIFTPGQMTLDFIQNRRARYVPPFRLYIFVSALFYIVLNITKVSNVDREIENGQFEKVDTTNNQIDLKILGVKINSKDDKYKDYLNYSERQLDSAMIADNDGVAPGYMTRILTKQFFKLQRENTDFVKSIVHLWVKYISVMMFFMMPIFAFFLRFLFYKRTRNYYEYLIFSVHYHTYCYIVFTAVLGINYFHWNSWLSLLAFILPFLILYKSLKKIYDTSRFQALLYSVSLNLSYSMILFTGILISLIIGALNA